MDLGLLVLIGYILGIFICSPLCVAVWSIITGDPGDDFTVVCFGILFATIWPVSLTFIILGIYTIAVYNRIHRL
jgi:hypothetical protein